MATVEELLVLIDATTEGLRKEMKRGADETEKFRKRVDRQSTRVEQRFKKLGQTVKRQMGGFVAALSATALIQFARSAIAAGDNIGKAAQTAGIAADQLQELRFAFSQLAGTTDKEVDESIRRFNRRIGLAIQGQGEAIKVSAALGIAFRDQGGAIRSTGDLLEEVVQKLAAVEDDSVRAAQASQLFGEDAGPRLAAALGNGIEAVDALREAVPGLLSNDQVKRAEALTDAFDAMARSVGGTLKGAFIDATAAAGRFFGVASAFVSVEEITGQIEVLQQRLRDLPREGIGGVAINQELVAQYETELDFLFDRLGRILGEKTSELNAKRLEQIDLSSLSIARLPTNVGANLIASMGDVRAGTLGLIPEQTATAFQLQLQQMTMEVDNVRNSVLSLEETNEERVDRMAEQWEGLGNAVGLTIRSTLADAFLGIETDWRETIKRMVADWLIQKAALGLAGSIGGGFGNFISGVFGRAAGGPVSGGSPYVVGERGPELFVPNVSGRIVSNEAMAGAGNVTVNMVNRFDVGLESVQGQIAAMTPRIAQETQRAMLKSMRRPRMA